MSRETAIPLPPAWPDRAVAASLGLHVRTLRRYLNENPGLCELRGKKRYMTEADIIRLRQIMREEAAQKCPSRSTKSRRASTTFAARSGGDALTEALALATGKSLNG